MSARKQARRVIAQSDDARRELTRADGQSLNNKDIYDLIDYERFITRFFVDKDNRFIPTQLYDWQRDVLTLLQHDKRPGFMAMAHRDSGKSRVARLYNAMIFINPPVQFPSVSMAVVAHNKEQAENSIKEIKYYLEYSIFADMISRKKVDRLETHAGSELVALPNSFKGVGSNLNNLYVDETAKVDDDVMYTLIPAVREHLRIKIILTTTPEKADGYFHDNWLSDKNNNFYAKYAAKPELIFDDNGELIGGKFLKPTDTVESFKLKLINAGPIRYKSEYLCEFLAFGDKAFNPQHLAAALPKHPADHPVIAPDGAVLYIDSDENIHRADPAEDVVIEYKKSTGIRMTRRAVRAKGIPLQSGRQRFKATLSPEYASTSHYGQEAWTRQSFSKSAGIPSIRGGGGTHTKTDKNKKNKKILGNIGELVNRCDSWCLSVDFGKEHDSTVFMVVGIKGKDINVYWVESYIRCDYHTIITPRLAYLVDCYHPDILVMDGNGVGDGLCGPISDFIKNHCSINGYRAPRMYASESKSGIRVGFRHTKTSTKQIVFTHLQNAFMLGRVHLPLHSDSAGIGTIFGHLARLYKELKLYEYTLGNIDPSGNLNIRFGKAKGRNKHDDYVDALAMAVWALSGSIIPHGSYSRAVSIERGASRRASMKHVRGGRGRSRMSSNGRVASYRSNPYL